ncbi:Metal tolerance protein C2-like protein [Drosera capensis]
MSLIPPPSCSSDSSPVCWYKRLEVLSAFTNAIAALEDASDVSEARFWEFVPGHIVGSLSLQVKPGVDGVDEQSIL